MPLSEKTRIEIYLPDLPDPAYKRLCDSLQREFTYSFGGATLVRGLSGSYLSRLGLIIEDSINLLYSDVDLDYEADADLIELYTNALQRAAYRSLNEETVLVAVFRVRHTK